MGELPTDAEAREYIDTLQKHFADSLTEWEEGFLQSCDGSLRAGRGLSNPQRHTLDKIMDEKSRQHGRSSQNEDDD